jgi:hypothetical protein
MSESCCLDEHLRPNSQKAQVKEAKRNRVEVLDGDWREKERKEPKLKGSRISRGEAPAQQAWHGNTPLSRTDNEEV